MCLIVHYGYILLLLLLRLHGNQSNQLDNVAAEETKKKNRKFKIKMPQKIVWIFQKIFFFNQRKNGKTYFAIIWIRNDAEKSPERRASFAANEPGRCHATELRDARFESSQTECFVGIMWINFTQHIFITLWWTRCKSIGTMNFQNWFDNLIKSINRFRLFSLSFFSCCYIFLA